MEICLIRNLFDETKRRVAGARQLCRLGQKDQGRDVLRSVRNGSVIEIVKGCDTSKFPELEMNWSLLEWELSQLEQDCHPASDPSCVNDLAKIAQTLDFIAGGISKLLSK